MVARAEYGMSAAKGGGAADKEPDRGQVRLTAFNGHVNPAFDPAGDDADLPPASVTGRSHSVSVPGTSRRALSRKVLYKRLPLLGWLPRYNSESAISDLVAGVTVGLTVIPQGIAYANVAGLPPQYGLYSSFMASFVYAVFGSCKDSPIGPTAIMAILTRENLHDMGWQGAVLLCFLTGCVQIVMGVLQLGFLIDFISGPVSVGFTSAAAIIIATTMLKDLLGLQFTSSKFLDTLRAVASHIGETRTWDAALGITCMAILLFLRKIKDLRVGPADVNKRTWWQRFAAQGLWFVSTARNILVVLVCGVIAYVLEMHGSVPFVLSAHVKGGLPTIQPPPFSVTSNNVTHDFWDMTSNFSSAIIVLPLLSILEDISLAKAFSEGRSIDATQEMLALGLCNLVSSFVGSMPVSGALSRGAVNNASGVRTPFGGVYTGILVLLSLYFFTPYFHYIPKTALAAVIIAAVVFMVEFHVIKPIWRTNKMDLIPAAATFVTCLLARLELGIVIGISFNVVGLLYASARPSVQVERHTADWGGEYLVITPDRSLVFPSADYVRASVSKIGVKHGSSSIPVVIDSRHVQGVDFTAAEGVKSLIADFKHRNQPLLFYNLKPSVVEVIRALGPAEFLYCDSEHQLHVLLRGLCTKVKPAEIKVTVN